MKAATLGLLAIAVVLGGCASSVTKRGLAANADGERIFQSCKQDAESRGVGAILSRTNFFDSESMPLPMLTDRDFTTEEEKIAIKHLADSWKLCGEKLVAWAKLHYNDQHASLYRMDTNRVLVQLARLYNGETRWGMFNIDLQTYDNKFAMAVQQSSDAYWAKQYADAERTRAAIGAALQAYGNALKDYGNTYAAGVRNQPVSPQTPVYDPITTECRSSGNQTVCSQYSALMSAPKILTCNTYGNRMTCTQ